LTPAVVEGRYPRLSARGGWGTEAAAVEGRAGTGFGWGTGGDWLGESCAGARLINRLNSYLPGEWYPST
jgi:hypothetical protein